MSHQPNICPYFYKISRAVLNVSYNCFRYVNGTHYLQEKYGYQGDELHMFMDRWFNFGVSFVFPSALFLINMVLYLIPLPAFIKAKFRE